MGTLSDHAATELDLLGVPDAGIVAYIKILRNVEIMHDAGFEYDNILKTLVSLIRGKNLTPLTDDKEEWEERTESLWQSNRNTEAFSLDYGRSYFLVSERDNKMVAPTYMSDHKEQPPVEEPPVDQTPAE